jgi:hypothetical protein
VFVLILLVHLVAAVEASGTGEGEEPANELVSTAAVVAAVDGGNRCV